MPCKKYDSNGYARPSNKKNMRAGSNRKQKGKRNTLGRRPKRRRPNSTIDIPAQQAAQKLTKRTRKVKEQHDPEVVATLEEQRLLISGFFVQVLKCPPPELWAGPDGTITEIMKFLRLKGAQRNKIKRVIKQTYDNYMRGRSYDGKILHNGGRPCDIEPGSVEEQMLADGKEDGKSHADVLWDINEYRDGKDLPLLGPNAITGALN